MRTQSVLVTVGCATITVFALGLLPRSRMSRDATHVVAVRAGGGDVPSNLLRVYVELSAAMEPGDAYRHIRVLDDAGGEVAGALLELREELWSPDHRRLTLLFDPGRVKRGIRANLEMGAPLRAGRRYHLVVDSAWRDARNHALATSYRQELRVGDPDTTTPDPSRWRLSSPRRGSREALLVEFGESLDHALALRTIGVVDGSGARVSGTAALNPSDRVWTFTPERPWGVGAVDLRIETELEDLAGNNVSRPFDADRRRAARSAEAALSDSTPRRVPITLR